MVCGTKSDNSITISFLPPSSHLFRVSNYKQHQVMFATANRKLSDRHYVCVIKTLIHSKTVTIPTLTKDSCSI